MLSGGLEKRFTLFRIIPVRIISLERRCPELCHVKQNTDHSGSRENFFTEFLAGMRNFFQTAVFNFINPMQMYIRFPV